MERCILCGAEFENVQYKGFSPHYCPHCGALLEGKENLVAKTQDEIDNLKKQASTAPVGKIYVNREEANRNITRYNEMVISGYAPSGKCIITEEENKKLNEIASLHDNWNKERNRIKNTADYHYVKHFTWDFYLGTIWAAIITVIGSVYLYGWIFPYIMDDLFRKDASDEVLQVLRDDTTGKFGIYDNKTKTLAVPYDYDSISHRKGNDYQGVYINFFYLYKNGKIGVADSTGKISINCELDATEGAYNGVVILQKGEKQGLMDCYGHQIIPCEYQYVLWQSKPRNTLETPGTYVGRIIPVKRDYNNRWELYNRDGRKIRGQQYKMVTQTGNPSLIKVVEDRRDYKFLYGIVDENGQIVIPCKYYNMSTFYNDRAWVKEKYNDSWSLIDTKGGCIITLAKDYTPRPFSEGLAAIQYKKKVGFCDTSGKIVIPMDYELTIKEKIYYDPSFHGGKANVSYNGVAGYIDKNGKFVAETPLNK